MDRGPRRPNLVRYFGLGNRLRRGPQPDQGHGGHAVLRTAEKPGVAMRYTKALPIQSVTVNGKPWTILCCDKEAIMLRGMTGRVTVVAKYWMGMPASAVVAHVSIGASVRRHRSLELGSACDSPQSANSSDGHPPGADSVMPGAQTARFITPESDQQVRGWSPRNSRAVGQGLTVPGQM